MDKKEVLRAYIQFLDQKIEDMEKSVDSLHRGVDTAPGPSQSHSDTTRFQQSGVASEASKRIGPLKRLRASIGLVSCKKSDYPGVGALIVLEDSTYKEKEYYFVISEQGGDTLEFDEGEVFFVSTQSPILEIVKDLKKGDTFEFRRRRLTFLDIL